MNDTDQKSESDSISTREGICIGPRARPGWESVNVKRYLVLMLIGISLFYWLVPRLGGFNPLVFALKMPTLILINLVFLFATPGLARVKIDGLFCSRCRYRFAPDGDNPEQCPECGAYWKMPGGVRELQKLRYPGLLIVSGGLCLLAIASFVVFVKSPSFFRSLIPTSALIDHIGRSRHPFHEWRELQTRTLSKDQSTTLARKIVAKCGRGRIRDDISIQWMWTQIQSGQLPDDIKEDFFANALDVTLVGPETAYVGQVFSFTVESYSTYTSRFAAVGKNSPVSFVWKTDDLTFSESRSDWRKGVLAYMFRGWGVEPGKRTIRLSYCVVYGPNPISPNQASWNSQGDLILPSHTKVAKQGLLTDEIEILPHPMRSD